MTADRKLWQRQIEREAYRRILAGEAPETLGELTQHILSWFRETHPGSQAMTLNKVEDQIRDTWHRRHELIHGGSSLPQALGTTQLPVDQIGTSLKPGPISAPTRDTKAISYGLGSEPAPGRGHESVTAFDAG
jgi:hypothetical protein